jgi:nicotinamidase-related amidase
LSHFAPPRAVLVCLDLQRNRQAGETQGPVVAQCRRVLAEARRRCWPVLHVHVRSLADSRPIAGLEPRPSEPVFLRQGPSAFSNANFTRAALALGGPLALIGFALEDTVLATAFAAADRDLAVDVILDAVFAGAHEPDAVNRVLLAPLRALAPRARLVDSDDLLVVETGRFAAANLP